MTIILYLQETKAKKETEEKNLMFSKTIELNIF